MKRHNFKELLVWQLAMEVVDDIYLITQHFPKEEIFGLSLQMRKSATSVPSNIAEGCGRGTDPQLIQFTDIAQGSAFELETQVYVTSRRRYCTDKELDLVLVKIQRVQKMIDGFQDRFR
jgi:four helix bundle protein